MIIKSWVKAPKYMHIESMLRKYALDAGFKVKINIDKGFFQETIFWEMDGTEEQMRQFRSDWNHFVSENT